MPVDELNAEFEITVSHSQIAIENDVTVRNLLKAFDRESNAHARYLEFAAKADSDCMYQAARLLRAAARSEKIHTDNHARVIRLLGGEPVTRIQTVEVNSTLENLKVALDEEIYEIDTMYPRFLVENRSAENSAARTFTWALEAEKTHVRLLSEEIKRIEAASADSPSGVPLDLYVRPVCGLVSKTPEPERCWVCDHFCTTFETIP